MIIKRSFNNIEEKEKYKNDLLLLFYGTTNNIKYKNKNNLDLTSKNIYILE